jgi:hypothetical protein
VLSQLPDTADELNAIGKSLGVAAADIHLGEDASETTLKRTPLAVDAGRRGRCALKFSNCASQYFSSDRGSD